jgi:arylsulfatase
MRYTLTDEQAPSAKHVQYFEMMGHRGIYSDGWKAVTRHVPNVPYDDDRWELYHVDADRSECLDLAAEQPERLAGLVELWWQQAREHGVLPLDDRSIELFGGRDLAVATQAGKGLAGLAGAGAQAAGRARYYSPHPASRHYTYYPPMSPMPVQAGARLAARSWDLDATIERPAGKGGVLYAMGNQNSGLSLFVQHDRLVFDYNSFSEHYVVESDAEVPEGESVVGVRFRRSLDSTGHVTLVIDGAECGRVDIPHVMLILSSIGPSVGFDRGGAVSQRYESPFTFEGRLHRVDIQVVSPTAGQAAAALAAESMSRQ